MEAKIVDDEFIRRKDTYNLQLGGLGVENQYGEKNPMYGKTAYNAKKLQAIHKDGTVLYAQSIQQMSELIGIARGNVRNLLQKGIQGKKGWTVYQLG